jgi:hypothetical protein
MHIICATENDHLAKGVVLGALLGGLFGYGLGRAPFQAWEGFINEFNARFGHLTYNRVIEPIEFYRQIENGKRIYAEGIYAFLFGLPDASLQMTFRCLEIGLKRYYQNTEKKKPSLTACGLIEWSEKELGRKKELVHGFRILRNLTHEETTITEQDNLEAIRHVTEVLNLIFPFQIATITAYCGTCRRSTPVQVSSDQLFLGNNIVVPCTVCKISTHYQVMPR